MIAIIPFVVFIFSHLTVDTDFDENTKMCAYIVLAILSLLYILFGIIF
jgi:hypothetical protein